MDIDKLRESLERAEAKLGATSKPLNELVALKRTVESLREQIRNAPSTEEADAAAGKLVEASEKLRLREITKERHEIATAAEREKCWTVARSILGALSRHYEALALEACQLARDIVGSLIHPHFKALHVNESALAVKREAGISSIASLATGNWTAWQLHMQAKTCSEAMREDSASMAPNARTIMSTFEADNARINSEIEYLRKISSAVRDASGSGGVMPSATATPEREPALAGSSAG